MIEWESTESGTKAADVTWGALRLLVDGEPVWGTHEIGFRWVWVDLLEFLTDVWPYIILDEGFPYGVAPRDVRSAYNDAWLNVDVDQDSLTHDDDYGTAIQEFLESHDISQALGGAFLPPVWIVREGYQVWTCSAAKVVCRPLSETLSTLEQVGDAIALKLGETNDQRARSAIRTWGQRRDVETRTVVAVASGLDENVRAEVERGEQASSFWELEEPTLETNELLAAARMARTASPAEIRQVISEVRRCEHRNTPEIDLLAQGATGLIDESSPVEPFEEGYALAKWLREVLGLSSSQAVDPQSLLSSWNVEVRVIAIQYSLIEAVACWGPRHGPCVIVNRYGRYSASKGGRRASLAHEIAHLLVDRFHGLPVAEVLGGRVSRRVEQRARAFAAEFLLPRLVAGERFGYAQSDPREAVRLLRNEYGVSKEVIAWQAHNARVELPEFTNRYLKTLVSRPWM